jgi:hypothetical protein
MLENKLLAELHDLAIRLAPELAELQLYIVPRSGNSAHGEPFIAFATTTAESPALRADLIACGKWQGPGNIVVIQHAPPSYAELAALFIHEISHLLPVAEVPDVEPTADELGHNRRLLHRIADPPPAVQLGPPWEPFHAADFVRRCLHLCRRGLDAGYEFPCDQIAAGPRYGLRGLTAYAIALGDETVRLKGASFAEIEATPAPQRFVDLFVEDVCRWHERNKA